MSETRRQFSPQFKAEAVQMVVSLDRSTADVARDLGITAALNRDDVEVTVADIIRELGLRAIQPRAYKRTTVVGDGGAWSVRT